MHGDHYIELESAQQPEYKQVLRVVTIWDQDKQGATTIAESNRIVGRLRCSLNR